VMIVPSTNICALEEKNAKNVPLFAIRIHSLMHPKPFIRNTAHSKEQESMLESLVFRLPIGPVSIADRHFHDFQILLGRAEQEIEVAKRIEVAEVVSAGLDLLVVSLEQGLRPAEGVAETLLQQPGENLAEHLVADQVEKPHGLPFHWIDHAASVDELAVAVGDRVIKLGEHFGVHGHISVEDRQHLSGGRFEPLAHGVPFSNAFALMDEADGMRALVPHDDFLNPV